jgi:predicted DCC family thiol-disulfide oxidoreductase YuxK
MKDSSYRILNHIPVVYYASRREGGHFHFSVKVILTVAMSSPIILYDGVCGLCNRFVQFVLRRDKKAFFRFASLQSRFAREVLARHGANTENLDTVCVVGNRGEAGEFLLSRSEAVAFVLRELGGFWRLVGSLLRIIPRLVRDGFYKLVARHRYRIFGRYESCPLPDAATRARFLDQ